MVYYEDIPNDIKKLLPPSTEYDVHFTNNRYTLGSAFNWHETREGWEFWNLVDRKLFNQARSLLNNHNMINTNYKKPYNFWMSNLPKKFVIEFNKRLRYFPNPYPMDDGSSDLNFEELIDLTLWEEQPEGHDFWRKLSLMNFYDFNALKEYLGDLKFKEIKTPKSIKLKW